MRPPRDNRGLRKMKRASDPSIAATSCTASVSHVWPSQRLAERSSSASGFGYPVAGAAIGEPVQALHTLDSKPRHRGVRTETVDLFVERQPTDQDPPVGAPSDKAGSRNGAFTSAGGCGAVLGVGAGEGLCAETAVRATTAVAAIARIVQFASEGQYPILMPGEAWCAFEPATTRECHLPGFSSHTCRTHTPRTVSGSVPRGSPS